MSKDLKLRLEYCRILGEYQGTVRGVMLWDIPAELKTLLEMKLKELETIQLHEKLGDE